MILWYQRITRRVRTAVAISLKHRTKACMRPLTALNLGWRWTKLLEGKARIFCRHSSSVILKYQRILRQMRTARAISLRTGENVSEAPRRRLDYSDVHPRRDLGRALASAQPSSVMCAL